jgi:hypothetical protein
LKITQSEKPVSEESGQLNFNINYKVLKIRAKELYFLNVKKGRELKIVYEKRNPTCRNFYNK